VARHIRTLVVDDDRALWRPTEHFLGCFGFNVEFAPDGESAIERACESKPDLILLDWELPGIQGIDVLAQLKSAGETEHIPVFMLTGREAIGDLEKAFEAGADDYVIKPLDMSRLGSVVKSRWRKYWKRPMIRTVVVEDDEVLWKAIERSLKRSGFEATMAPDGPSGIQLARKMRPGLILLDWKMPGMEGTEVLAELKSEGSTRRIPVFMLTGKGLIADVEQAFDCGADDYIIKPLNMATLGRIVNARWNKHLEKKGRRRLVLA